MYINWLILFWVNRILVCVQLDVRVHFVHFQVHSFIKMLHLQIIKLIFVHYPTRIMQSVCEHFCHAIHIKSRFCHVRHTIWKQICTLFHTNCVYYCLLDSFHLVRYDASDQFCNWKLHDILLALIYPWNSYMRHVPITRAAFVWATKALQYAWRDVK